MNASCIYYRNYAPTIAVQAEATERGCQQVLWLYGDEHQMTEVGTMNLFMHWHNKDGGMYDRVFWVT